MEPGRREEVGSVLQWPLKEGVHEKNKLVLKYNKWSPDIHTMVHFSTFNFKFWITQLRSRITQSWARS